MRGEALAWSFAGRCATRRPPVISSLQTKTSEGHHAWARGLARDAVARARREGGSTGCVAFAVDGRASLLAAYGPGWLEAMERKVAALVERIVGDQRAFAYESAGAMFLWLPGRDARDVAELAERVRRSARFGGDARKRLVTVRLGTVVDAPARPLGAAASDFERLEAAAREGLVVADGQRASRSST